MTTGSRWRGLHTGHLMRWPTHQRREDGTAGVCGFLLWEYSSSTPLRPAVALVFEITTSRRTIMPRGPFSGQALLHCSAAPSHGVLRPRTEGGRRAGDVCWPGEGAAWTSEEGTRSWGGREQARGDRHLGFPPLSLVRLFLARTELLFAIPQLELFWLDPYQY